MKIRPLHDRVIVKRMEEERTSPGGIVIPDAATEKPIKGEIIAAGNGKILESGEVSNVHRKVPEMLEKLIEESGLTSRPYIDLHALCDLHALAPVKNKIIIKQLKEQGYEATRTHFKPTAIRTDATVKEVAKIIAEHNAR